MFFSWIFDLLFINSSKNLLFGVYFSLHERNTALKHKLQRKLVMKEIQIDIHFQYFYFSLILMFKNLFFFFASVFVFCWGFFPCRVKIAQQLLIFLGYFEDLWTSITSQYIFFFSTQLRDIAWCIKIQTRLFICLSSIVSFSQITPSGYAQ